MSEERTQHPAAEGLRSAMARRAGEDRAKRLDAARAEADRILAEAEEAAEAEAAQIEQSAAQQLEAQQRLWQEQDESDVLRIRQTARHGLAHEVLDGVRRSLNEVIRGGGFADVLARLYDEALAVAQDQTDAVGLLVKCPPDHVAELQQHAGKGIRVEADEALEDGISLQDGAGSFRVRNTLGARLAKLEPEIRRRAAEDLSGVAEGQ